MSSPRPSTTHALLSLRTLVLLVVALILGAVVGALTFATAENLAPALLAGCAAFGASIKVLHDLVE